MQLSSSPTTEAAKARTPVYPLPEVLRDEKVNQTDYNRWLRVKAAAHVKRDRKRWKTLKLSVAGYKRAIHEAVGRHKGLDPYTGKKLSWDQLRTYNNEQSKAGGSTYKRKFNLLPTIDHVDNGATENPRFEVLSWEVNDAKNDMSHDSFIQLCQAITEHMANKPS